jgi:glycolate oxidase FAD binding subunit
VDASSLHIDGFGPIPIRAPSTVAELGECVRDARRQGQAVYPIGGRTRLSLGMPPSREGIGLETGALNQVIDYPSRDLTITVQAGIRVRDLQAILAKENQRLAVEVPDDDLATLGGALAVNSSGPRRYGSGTLRDYLIGVSFVNDDGNEIKSGGRVVKNVAGYDMCKLLIGSLGTLGIITQATLKLRPLPEAAAMVGVYTELDRIENLLSLVHESQTRPCSLDLVNCTAMYHLQPHDFPDLRWLLLVGFEDNSKAMEWQVKKLDEELRSHRFESDKPILGPHCDRFWNLLTNFDAPTNEAQWLPDELFCLRTGVPTHALSELIQSALKSCERWQVVANAGTGIARFQQVIDSDDREMALKAWRALQQTVAKFGGHVVVERCPTEWKAGLDVWGPPREDYWLMKRIKASFDPDNIFNPGRFVAGI